MDSRNSSVVTNLSRAGDVHTQIERQQLLRCCVFSYIRRITMSSHGKFRLVSKDDQIEFGVNGTVTKRMLKRTFLVILVVITALVGAPELLTAIDLFFTFLK